MGILGSKKRAHIRNGGDLGELNSMMTTEKQYGGIRKGTEDITEDVSSEGEVVAIHRLAVDTYCFICATHVADGRYCQLIF